MKTIACLAGLLVAGSAAAQQFVYPTIEDAAKLTEKHALKFERDAAYGMRLDIAAGTAVRFEPGQTREVHLVALAGKRTIYGFRGDVMGKL